VVAESSTSFAAEAQGIYGSRSSAAQLLGAHANPQAEDAVMDTLEQALQAALGLPTAGADRQLMRWGAAFPQPPGLPPELSLCAASQIGFCGDAIAGPGFGRVEGALRSAEALAGQLLLHLGSELS
jgi:predicted NAD/FAD-dependent oxidoreductase